MKYYKINKEKGIIEVIDSETNRVEEVTPSKTEENKQETPQTTYVESVVNEKPVVDEKLDAEVKPTEDQKPTVEESIDNNQSTIKKELPKNIKGIIIAAVCMVAVIGALVTIYFTTKSFSNSGSQQETIKESEEIKDQTSTDFKELWKTNKAINDDYVGQLVFESGLINQPVVQGINNEVYFRTNWKDMSHDEEGTVFMDYRNEPDDQNTIIYGHYVYPSYETDTLGLKEAKGDRMFTPLAKLTDKANYESNKYIDLYLENEVIRYEVAVVYHCPLDPETDYVAPVENMYYSITNYDEEYFETYKKAIYENAFYDTGVDISYSDKLLTLQTCVENHDELLEIVVCKEISRKAY